ncbi:hypothetical protein PR048_030422 [Dryococelus australis]|uniref:Uncharacterized protein n=1 Tax=Dryococelus australis TaxID=614101 RepID=A0ABQ9G8Y6_9NEOP|nr:hypothetical protein PR048_030422 [Dryococelus australis]
MNADVGSQLIYLCETCWVERHDDVSHFLKPHQKLQKPRQKSYTLATLHALQQDCKKSFSILHMHATSTAAKLKIDLTMARQMHRANYVANSTEEYYRQSVYIPLLDVITYLEQHFSQDTLHEQANQQKSESANKPAILSTSEQASKSANKGAQQVGKQASSKLANK